MSFVPPQTSDAPTRSRSGCSGFMNDRGGRSATVSLANKHARILWAVMSKGVDFDPSHVSRRSSANTGAATASGGANADSLSQLLPVRLELKMH